MLSEDHIEAISRALGDTEEGLTGSEIDHLLASCGIENVSPSDTKWRRIHNAFANHQNKNQSSKDVYRFMRAALKPSKYLKVPEKFEVLRTNLNVALAFVGIQVGEDGSLRKAGVAKTINEAQRKANELRSTLSARDVHPDVLLFCKAELLADNYFHAVLEAVKSVFEKIRQKTGLRDDGNTLVDRALVGKPPMLAINGLGTDSELSEQKGFANLVRGVNAMFRNPTAHTPKISWNMSKEDATDILGTISLIHRKLDIAKMPPRT